MKIFKQNKFLILTSLAALAVVTGLSNVDLLLNGDNRLPSSQVTKKSFELHLQSLSLPLNSRLQGHEKVFLKATFNKDAEIDIGSAQPWTLNQGDTLEIDYKISVLDSWIKDNQLEFKLELVHQGWFKSTLVRCSQVAKDLTAYNRAYQCTIPGDQQPLLTYRLAEKGVPPPANTSVPVAANNK